MRRYAALLRGINVGGHNVKMDRLRAVFEELGYADVSTFIASGNVLFNSDLEDPRALEAEIEVILRDRLGYGVATFVRSGAELNKIVESTPFSPADVESGSASLYVTLVREQVSEVARRKIDALRSDTDDFDVVGREVYWLCRTRMSESPVFARGLLEKAIAAPATSRNITTISKLAALLRDTR